MTKTITRDLVRALRADLDAALVEIGKKHGVAINTGNISFNDQTASIAVRCIAGAPAGADPVIAQAEIDWKRQAARFGFAPDWLGAKVGSAYTVRGLLPRRSKFPVLVTDSAGKKICMSYAWLVNAHVDGQLKLASN